MKYIINKNVNREYIINKSKFIVCLRVIDNKADIEVLLSKIKNEYKNATHYCYAYIVDSFEKCSDDKEPSGTAGLPILNILKKNNLTNILCVVVRYFGGIKLGAGGLVRAYSNTVSDTINEIEIIEQINYKNIKISFNYDKLKDIEYILKDCIITSKDFKDNIVFEVKINEILYEDIFNMLKNMNIQFL